MIHLTDESKKYFIPLSADNVHVNIDYVPEKNEFDIVLYEEKQDFDKNGKEIVRTVPPKNYTIANFASRFRHGCRVRYSSSLPDFSVPANLWSLTLLDCLKGAKKHFTKTALPKMTELRLQSLQADSCAERWSKAKTNNFADIPQHEYLKPYQKAAADIALSTDAYNLHFEQGCGKTPTAIYMIDKIAKQVKQASNRTAIIGVSMPKALTTNWEAEIQRFSKIKTRIVVINGNPLDRTIKLVTAFAPNPELDAILILAGYDAAQGTEFFTKIQWDAFFIDESQNLANHSTDRTKFFIENVRNNSQRRYSLTGTPIRKTPFDLYSQLEWLRPQWSQLTSYNQFKEFYGYWVNNVYTGRRALESFQNIPMLQELLLQCSARITKKEALPFLPERTFERFYVTMTDEQRKAYIDMADNLQAEFDLIEESDAMSVNNHLTKMLRLAQITSGYATLDEKGIYRFDPNPKLDAMAEMLLDKSPDSKTLIWAVYHENIKQIRARLELEGIRCVTYHGGRNARERDYAVSEFNTNPECRVFIGQPGAGGVGLNLLGYDPQRPDDYTTNADHSIYFGLDWNSIHRWQSADRNHRIGTRVPVLITDLVVRGTIDEVILERLNEKAEIAHDTQNVKELMKACLLK